MAKLYIEEWGDIAIGTNEHELAVPKFRIGNTTVDITASALRTASDFDSRTTYLILYADADAQINLGGSAVTVDGTGLIMPNGSVRTIGIEPGDTRIAVIEKQ